MNKCSFRFHFIGKLLSHLCPFITIKSNYRLAYVRTILRCKIDNKVNKKEIYSNKKLLYIVQIKMILSLFIFSLISLVACLNTTIGMYYICF